PQSGLVNGYGTYNCSFAAADEPCEQHTELQELVVPPDSLVRLRMINAGAHPEVLFSVDEHELNVVEADDTPTQPLPVHRVPINIAQRYSGVFNTTGAEIGDSFYLRATINTACLGTDFSDLDVQTLVVIRIGEDDSVLGGALPDSQDWNDPTVTNCTDLDESQLVPLDVRAAPSTASQIRVFNSSFAITDYFRWTMNDVSFSNLAYNPLLHQVWRGETIDPNQVATVEVDDVSGVDIVINNVQGPDHPFHLHNLRFWVLARGTGLLNETVASTLDVDTTNPLRRDTITVPGGSWALLRVLSDMPGVHAFHCHILFHQAVGLVGALVVQPERVRELDIPQRNLDLCRGGNMSIIDPGCKRSLPNHLVARLPAAPVKTAAVDVARQVKAKKRSLLRWW
ncbi:hypothetical protein JCM8097_007790, partial [Rhodosporidiobolus ruineniae]